MIHVCRIKEAGRVQHKFFSIPSTVLKIIVPVNRYLPVGSRAEVEPGNFSLIVSLIRSTKDDGATIGVFSISENSIRHNVIKISSRSLLTASKHVTHYTKL